MILVIAKSDLNDVILLPVTIATEMRYPGVGTKKNSVNISGAMDFYAVFRTVIVINNGKMEKWLKIKQNNVFYKYFGFLTFFAFFATFHGFSNFFVETLFAFRKRIIFVYKAYFVPFQMRYCIAYCCKYLWRKKFCNLILSITSFFDLLALS